MTVPSVPSPATLCTTAVTSATGSWTAAYMSAMAMGNMSSGTTIYDRDCFVCGKPMVRMAKGSHTLICKPCEITENGTVQGKFPRANESTGTGWGDEVIPYTDHGVTTCPSPDTIGYHDVQTSGEATESPLRGVDAESTDNLRGDQGSSR